jgi:hypothetical protein
LLMLRNDLIVQECDATVDAMKCYCMAHKNAIATLLL